jgi:superfamily I DNA/RNA helicase
VQSGVPPPAVVTFTEKVAAELKDRIKRLVREILGNGRGLDSMFAGTVYSYCLNLLHKLALP